MKRPPEDSGIPGLISLIETLRGESGCPWDRQQTPKTMIPYLIEEVYELLDAIDSGSPDRIREELGDVLFQVLFLGCLYQADGSFDIGDAAGTSIAKMIRRHPHVFSHGSVDTADAVRKQWHEIKEEERADGPPGSLLDSIPAKLPALLRCYRISERAGSAGFDWEDVGGVLDKVEEEWCEFKGALLSEEDAEGADALRDVELEFGDILFTLVNVARFLHIHPETALGGSIGKFEKRFRHMESGLLAEGKTVGTVTRDELNRRWELAKAEADEG